MIMTKLVLKPFSKVYLLECTIFSNKINHSTLQQCNLEKYYTNRTLHTFSNRSSKSLLGNESGSLRKSQAIKGASNFFTNSAKSNELMDMNIQFHVPFFKKFITPLQYVRLQRLDSEFDFVDFKESAKYALEVVLNCLSNENYAELEPLLTKECRAEVEQNVKMMTQEKRMDLAISSSDIFNEDGFLDINTDEKDGKTFGQITMIYFVAKNFKGLESIRSFWDQSTKENREEGPKNLKVYNCTFIKEFVEGLNTQWKINRINFFTLQLQYTTRLF